jgi:anti-sigma B factor antagonist
VLPGADQPLHLMNAAFRVDSEEIDNIHAFRVVGELDQATASQLSRPLMQAIDEDSRAVLVDLTECEFIDSTGLAILVDAHERLTRADGRSFAICCANSQVRRLLEITGIDQAMSLHPSRDEALAALRA